MFGRKPKIAAPPVEPLAVRSSVSVEEAENVPAMPIRDAGMAKLNRLGNMANNLAEGVGQALGTGIIEEDQEVVEAAPRPSNPMPISHATRGMEKSETQRLKEQQEEMERNLANLVSAREQAEERERQQKSLLPDSNIMPLLQEFDSRLTKIEAVLFKTLVR